MRPKPGPESKKPKMTGHVPPEAWESPPDHLTEGAKSEWLKLVSVLSGMGRLGVSDPSMVELYATNVDIAREAYRKVMRDGLTVESDRGNVSKHPLLEAFNAATVRVKSISTALGVTLSPTDLSRVEPPAKGKDDPDDHWAGILRIADET